ncbi:MAG: tetratricopeptide repeat protein [Myxococcota bacterium]
MKNLVTKFALLSVMFVLLTGGNCSRARVESLTAMNEGVAYAQMRRYAEAEEALTSATVMDPTNDQAFYNLALVHIEQRQFERAKEALERAIAQAPEAAGFLEKLGTVQMQLEDWAGAKESFERAIELDPEIFKAYFKLAQVLEQTDDPQNALHQYTASIEHGPRFLEAYSALGRLYADLGYLNEAAQVLQSGLQVALEGTEEQASLHHLLGTVYQDQRNYDQAVDQFRSALDINPGMRDALFSLGWTYSLQDNREEARRFLKKFVDVAGGDAPANYMQAARTRLGELGVN